MLLCAQGMLYAFFKVLARRLSFEPCTTPEVAPDVTVADVGVLWGDDTPSSPDQARWLPGRD